MADELTVGDAMKMARDAGIPADAMRAQFKANTGYDLDQVNPHWTLDRIRRMREIDRANPKPRLATNAKSSVQSFVEDVAVGVAGIPAMAAGAVMQGSGTFSPTAGTSGELADDPFGSRERNMEAVHEARRVVAERANKPMMSNAVHDSADILTGGYKLLELGLGTADHAGKREPGMLNAIGAGIADRFNTGQQLAAGAIGGTAGQYSALLENPAEAIRTQPLTWALETLPLVGRVGAAAKALGRSQRAGRFATVADAAGEAASPGPAGRVDITPDEARPLTERAKLDAIELKKRVDEGVLTPEQAGAIMEKRFPGLVGPVSAAMTSAADAVAKGAGALKGAAAGAVFGDILPGGPLVGAAIGAAVPSLAGMAKARIPAGVRAAAARRFDDPNAQPEPQETVRARKLLDESRHGRGGIVAATERAGGRMEQGAELSREVDPVPVPSPGQVRVEVTPEGAVQPPRAESYGRDAVSAMVGDKAAEIGLRQDVAAQMRQSIKDLNDPGRIKELQQAVMAEQRAVSGDRATKAPGLKQEIAATLRPDSANDRFVPEVPFKEREVDEAAGLKTPTGTTSRVVRSSDPALERAVDDVHELVNRGGTKEHFTRDEVGRWVTEPMNADSLTVLRDAGMRGLVEARITAGLGDKAAAAVRAQLDDAIANLNRHALSDAPDALLVRLPDGTEINTRDMAALVRSELSQTSTGRAKVAMMMRSATRRVGLHLAMQAEQTSLARAIEGEFQRTHSDQSIVQDSQIPTKASIQAVGRGEPMPMVMTVDPREAGARMAAHPNVVAAELGMHPQQIKGIAERLRDDYMPVPDGPVMDFMRAAEKRGDIELPTGRMFVTKGFYESLKNRIDGIEAFRQAADFHLKMGQAIKLGKTVYNPAAHLHNITSNLVYQAVRLGKNPLMVAREWTQTATEWKDYLAGKTVKNERAMRSLGKTGFADTHALDDELSALSVRPAKSIPGVIGKAAATVKKGATVAQHAYKLGDNIPKLHEGLRNWIEIDDALQRMAPGRTIVLDTERGTKIVLRKTADGKFETPNGRVLEYGDTKLDDLVAQAAIRPAINIFVDYGSNPLYLASMKRTGVGSMFSPFYSWFYNTMDRPGHKGLVSHMVDYAGGAPYWTDDAALSAGKAKQAVALAAKRTGYISASRNLLHEDRDELSQTFGYTPRGMHLMDMRAVPDSLNYYDVTSWESANPFAATDLLWRMGGSAIAQATGVLPGVKDRMFPDNADGQPVTPEMKKLRYLWSKDKTGEWFSGEDALAVIGQSGGPLLDVMKTVDDAQRQGKEVDPGKLGMLFLSLMVGGGATSLADVTVGAASPSSSLTSRRKIGMMSSDSDPEGAIVQYERIGDMMARKLLTLGSRSVSKGEAEKWRKRKFNAFSRSLTAAMKKRSSELLLSSDGSETPEQLREQDAVWQALSRMGEIAREIGLDRMERGFTVDDEPRGAPQ